MILEMICETVVTLTRPDVLNDAFIYTATTTVK